MAAVQNVYSAFHFMMLMNNWRKRCENLYGERS